MTLPDIPRLYTALAEVLAVLVLRAGRAAPRCKACDLMRPRRGGPRCWACFCSLPADVPLAWWLPCMVAAIAWLYLYLWGTREMNLLEAGYSCARAFILAELAASVEWQLHCVLWPQQRAAAAAFAAAAGGGLRGGLRHFCIGLSSRRRCARRG